MRQIPLDLHGMAPGRVVEWRLRAVAADGPTGRQVGSDQEGGESRQASFNQDRHHCAATLSRPEADRPASWLAVTFEVAGALDEAAMGRVLLDLVDRHEVLRSTFRRVDGELSCRLEAVGDLALDLCEVGVFDSGELVGSQLAERFRQCIDTLSWPLFVAGAVLREESATVYLAFDHIVCDGMSMPIVVDELLTAYEAALREGEADLPPAPSYLDFAGEQRRRYLSIGLDDARLGYWKSFVSRGGSFFPHFPLDLGVRPGRTYPTVNVASTLLDGEEADLFEQRCLAVGGRPFMGVLAAVAATLREAGGPGRYRGLMPVSERGRGPWAHSVGWFVNTLPIEFDASAGQGFGHVVGAVRAAFTEMIAHVDVPFVRAWELLAPEEFAACEWPYPVNFFSYLDMRKSPGADRHARCRPTAYVWSARSNGTSTWFHRDHEGLHANSIHVDTAPARRTMNEVQEALRETVRGIARSGTDRAFATLADRGLPAARSPRDPLPTGALR